MKMLSLEPDEDMRWIYDYTHPDYNTDRAKWLRARRDSALRQAPQWMIEDARMNDIMRNMDWLARSTGQRMRTEKPKNNS